MSKLFQTWKQLLGLFLGFGLLFGFTFGWLAASQGVYATDPESLNSVGSTIFGMGLGLAMLFFGLVLAVVMGRWLATQEYKGPRDAYILGASTGFFGQLVMVLATYFVTHNLAGRYGPVNSDAVQTMLVALGGVVVVPLGMMLTTWLLRDLPEGRRGRAVQEVVEADPAGPGDGFA